MEAQPAMLKLAKAMIREGRDTEGVLGELRRRSCSPFDSLKVLMAAYGLSLSEAKAVLDNSQAWRDQRANFEALDNGLANALGHAEEDPPDSSVVRFDIPLDGDSAKG